MSTHMIEGICVIFPDYTPPYYKKIGLREVPKSIRLARKQGVLGDVLCFFVDFPWHNAEIPRIIGVKYPSMPRDYYKWRDWNVREVTFE